MGQGSEAVRRQGRRIGGCLTAMPGFTLNGQSVAPALSENTTLLDALRSA